MTTTEMIPTAYALAVTCAYLYECYLFDRLKKATEKIISTKNTEIERLEAQLLDIPSAWIPVAKPPPSTGAYSTVAYTATSPPFRSAHWYDATAGLWYLGPDIEKITHWAYIPELPPETAL